MGRDKIIYWDRLISLLTFVVLLATIALQRNGRVLGNDPIEIAKQYSNKKNNTHAVDTLTIANDGTLIVHTKPLAENVIGFGGPTPLDIYIKNGIIDHVEALSNSETPEFFDNAQKGILSQYNGIPFEQAISMPVDAVAGATYSSKAIITNMRRGMVYAQTHLNDAQISKPSMGHMTDDSPFCLKNIIAYVVILMAALLPMWMKGKGYRWTQLLLNVAVLGVWCGTFLSYTLFVNIMSNGIDLITSIAVILMLIVAFIYPLIGKSRHYCQWICPLGSAQEILSKITKRKLRITKKANKVLALIRWGIWSVLMTLMLVGVWGEWMDYEIFSIFIFSQASWIVIALSAIFAVLSIVITRPYCRFLCPTGCLMQSIENRDIVSPM